jgi:hypothetical protein
MPSSSCRKQVEAGKLEAAAAAQQLQHLQDKGSIQLAARSLQPLALAGDSQAQQQFAADSSGQAAAGSLSCVTCMDAVRQAKDEVSTHNSSRQIRTMLCQKLRLLGSAPAGSTTAQAVFLQCTSAVRCAWHHAQHLVLQ